MKLSRTALAPALLALLAAVPAWAQRESNERPAFSGAWTGVVGGYDHGTIKVSGDGPGDTASLSSNRGFYGGVIGYDYNPKGVVYGVEAEVSGGGFSHSSNGENEADRLRLGRDLYFGGRIGIPVTRNAMVYFKGGYANLRVVGNSIDDDVPLHEAINLDGYRVGGGAQVEHGPFLARLEYRFSDYRHDRDVIVHRDQVAAIVGYRF